jgi:type VI secretion system secreted protein VgrG
VSDECLLSGQSDSQGKLLLSGADQRTLQDEWNRTPDRLFIVSEGHVHKLSLAVDQGQWAEQQMLDHALEAKGYGDAHQCADDLNVRDFHAPLARAETGLKSAQALLDDTRKSTA